MWSGAYVATAILTWRRSRFAPLSFLVAIGLLLFPASLMFPAQSTVFPSFITIGLVAFLGYRYLQRA